MIRRSVDIQDRLRCVGPDGILGTGRTSTGAMSPMEHDVKDRGGNAHDGGKASPTGPPVPGGEGIQ